MGSSTQASCDVYVFSRCPCHGRGPHAVAHGQGVHAWLGGQGLALVPRDWPDGDTGSGGACVAGRGCAWQVTKPSGDGQGVGTAELWGGCMVAVMAGELPGYRGMNLPQRILVKEIIGKGDVDKLQILKNPFHPQSYKYALGRCVFSSPFFLL